MTPKHKKPTNCEYCGDPLPWDYPEIYWKAKRCCRACWKRFKTEQKQRKGGRLGWLYKK